MGYKRSRLLGSTCWCGFQRAIEAILKANTIYCPIETGRNIQYSAPLRRVAKDQDCLAPYVGADFTEYQRSEVRLESSKNSRYWGPIIFPSLFHVGLCPIKHN